MTHTCNKSLTAGMFPSRLSVAKAKCNFESGDRKSIKNYRPIYILPSFSKTLEKNLTLQLTTYFDANSFLTPSQFGFRANHLTELACHSAVRNIFSCMNAKKYVIGLFIDLAKAFYSLDRAILWKKLEFYGDKGSAFM